MAATAVAAGCSRQSDATPHRAGGPARHRAGRRQRADSRSRALWRDDGLAARAPRPRRPTTSRAMLASIEGIFDATSRPHRAGLSRRAHQRRPRAALRVRDRPAELPAPAAGVRRRRTTSPPRSSPTRSRRLDGHRARRDRRRRRRRCSRRCRRPERRRICRWRWPRSSPAKWISTTSCSRAITSASSSTSPSATAASSATARSSAATLHNDGTDAVTAIRFEPAGGPAGVLRRRRQVAEAVLPALAAEVRSRASRRGSHAAVSIRF